jgi:hypothetical protein
VVVLLTLASVLFAYRLGLWVINWRQPCQCLGALTGGLGISVAPADLIAKIMIFGMAGGYYFLWRSRLATRNN